MHVHLDWMLFGLPLLPIGFEIAQELLLLGIDRNDWSMHLLKLSYPVGDIAKLLVSIRMVAPFLGLAIALQTVIKAL